MLLSVASTNGKEDHIFNWGRPGRGRRSWGWEGLWQFWSQPGGFRDLALLCGPAHPGWHSSRYATLFGEEPDPACPSREERTMDDLLKWRGEFPILDRTTYMISNSLGAMPRGVYE